MGISFSCPLLDDLDSRFESYLVRSISFVGDDTKTALRSISFNGLDSEPGIMKSVAFKSPSPDVEDNVTLTPVDNDNGQNCEHLPKEESMTENILQMPSSPRPDNLRHLAALRLQKTYKSFRIRRQLADCAVLVEQRWWKILDFAELKRSSISFFEIEKPETAISRWSRARTRAAKVGKGLSKDEKARKLALQHWLEAIDPRHRYGHNLQFYYLKWLHCESRQPFFYWLDVGEGREVTLERCPRLKLQQQCIKYLGPMERKEYEVTVVDGNFMYKQSGKLIDTSRGPEDAKWIFVLSVSRILYVGLKKKGTFQHSSFLAGGATLSAGRLVVENGILKAVWPHSGHYLPTEENFEALMSFLLEHNVDLSIVQRSPGDDGEEVTLTEKESSLTMHSSKSEPDLGRMTEEDNTKSSERKKTNSRKQYSKDAENLPPTLSRRSRGFSSALTTLEIPKRVDLIEMFMKEEQLPRRRYMPLPVYSSSSSDEDGYETAEEFLSDEEFMISKSNLYDEDEEEEYEEPVPKEKIIQRINSHKGMKSYQLAQQLTCTWTTGAGPRIGFMRDYPSELQFRVLEEVNLSPRSNAYSPRRSTHYNSKFLNSSNLSRETPAARSPLGLESK